jgi:septal ring factor EnvC (AmiA/AmiB activator)
MKTASTAFLAVLVISSAGIWGCAQQKNSTQARRIHDLEARYAKLEEDYRTVVATSESTRKNLTRLELQRLELTQQVEDLKLVVQERDELKQRLAARTQERDAVHSQLLQFGKDLQNFAQRVESVANAGYGTVQGIPVSLKNN